MKCIVLSLRYVRFQWHAARCSVVAKFIATLFALLIVPTSWLWAADAATESEELATTVAVAPIVIDGDVLFRVRGISAFPADERAAAIVKRIKAIAADKTIAPESITITEVEQGSRIAADNKLLLVVLDGDAQLDGADRAIAASAYAARIVATITSYRRDRSVEYLLRSALYAVVATIGFALLLWVGMIWVRRLDKVLDARVKSKLQGLETQSLRILSAAHIWTVLRGARYLLWATTVLMVTIGYLDFILHLFPWTRFAGVQLTRALLTPLGALAEGLLTALPNLLLVIILIMLARYLLTAIKLPFTGIANGTLQVASFEADWAWPTYRLIRLLVIALTLVVAYPYIPGSQSDAFKGVSILLGVLVSLGSTSVTSNIVAGYSMIYRRTFKPGDRVRIEDHVGEVIESRLLATYLRTPKNEQVIIPNATVLNGSVVNYSTMAREGKLILHTTVGIGYETPWRQVEAMLLQAAQRSAGFVKGSQPFILQKSLGDFCVVYELNVYCDDAATMNSHYTELHRHILDVFNEYNVQIMTPHYEVDTVAPKVVPKDQWYAAPAKAAD